MASSNPAPPSLLTAATATCEDNMNLPMEKPPYPHHQGQDPSIESQPQVGRDMENNTHLMQQVIHDSNRVLSYDEEFILREKKRRADINDKYALLANLAPNSSKRDRAAVVGYAIDYIKEMHRRVHDLKVLVGRKRRSRKIMIKSEETQVDVHIIDYEVTIKVIQRKKTYCLLTHVSKTLDLLQLDLYHVAGGITGGFYIFLFSSKRHEGSNVSESAIASTLMEAVECQCASCSRERKARANEGELESSWENEEGELESCCTNLSKLSL